MKNVFISRPNWVPASLEAGLLNFYKLLEACQVTPRTIGRSDYPSKSPLDEVVGLLKKCDGTIVLGIPQIEVASGIIKGEAIASQLTLSTEWNHIEAALAYSLEHPLLVVRHLHMQRGIFDKGTGNYFLHQVDFADPSWALSGGVNGALLSWVKNLGSAH